MTEYMIPAEPDGPVWGKDGTKWEKSGGQFWNSDGSTLAPWTWNELLPWTWNELLQYHGPVTDCPPEPDPWESVKPGRLYWVTGHNNFWGKVRGLAMTGVTDSERECLRGPNWWLMRSHEDDRLQSAVELTAIPTHLLDALIGTAVDYDDPEDGTAVSREALHDLTDWLADHPQNEETK